MSGEHVFGEAHLMYERKKTCVGKRYYRRRRNLAVLISSLCLALAMAMLFGSFLSEAEAKEPEVTYYKYYANVEIQPGDTIWDLAEDYMDENYESREAYIREVKELNSLSDTDSIVSGQYLILPYYSTEYKL